jgi:hypothetical protein
MMLDGAQAMAWRLRQHALEPVSGTTAAEVVRRVIALRGWPLHLAEMAICVRQSEPDPGALDQALEAGDVIRSYAFRGGSYVFTPEIGAVLLSVRTTSRVWETRRYQQQGHFTLDDWEPFRRAVNEALTAGPKTRDEIGAHLARIPALRHLTVAATGVGGDSLYKPLHWWGDICFGPTRDGQATFRLMSDDSGRFGPAEVDEAGRQAVVLYLGAYGPATFGNLVYWFTEGLSVPRRRLQAWLADLGDELTEVRVDGMDAYALAADLNQLSEAEPSDAARLLPGFDPWIMGPGTADTRVLAPERRTLATRGANLVVSRGVVCGTWVVHARSVTVNWFNEAGPAPVAALEFETQRLASIRAQELDLTIEKA